jgi:hypothetical protein
MLSQAARGQRIRELSGYECLALVASVRALDDDEVRALPPMPDVQVDDVRMVHLRITPRSLTGRRLVSAD